MTKISIDKIHKFTNLVLLNFLIGFCDVLINNSISMSEEIGGFQRIYSSYRGDVINDYCLKQRSTNRHRAQW